MKLAIRTRNTSCAIRLFRCIAFSIPAAGQVSGVATAQRVAPELGVPNPGPACRKVSRLLTRHGQYSYAAGEMRAVIFGRVRSRPDPSAQFLGHPGRSVFAERIENGRPAAKRAALCHFGLLSGSRIASEECNRSMSRVNQPQRGHRDSITGVLFGTISNTKKGATCRGHPPPRSDANSA
jgi:hypothetical protein